MTGLTGGCGCGAVRYRLLKPPMLVHCCHCKDCQRQAGSAFAINAIMEKSNVDLLQGTIHTCTMPTDSGRPHDFFRCTACETTLWSDYGRRRTMLFVRVGTLDEPGLLPPDVHIFTRSRLPWVTLPAEVPAFDVFYPSVEEFWPEPALSRRRVLGF